MPTLLGDVVTTREAAELLKLSPYTIAAWLSQGKLRRIKVGSRTLIAKSDLEKLLQASWRCRVKGIEKGRRWPAF
jgi:excisionase family DNA binding protein